MVGEGEKGDARPSVPAPLDGTLLALSGQLLQLERRLRALEKTMQRSLRHVPATERPSARNLVHYVALRQHDLRELQLELSKRGLSSLGRSESSVLGALLQVSSRAQEALALEGDRDAPRELRRLERAARGAMSWEAAQQRLHEQTHAVLGPRPQSRHIYIMVTAPSAKEADRAWLARLLEAGMNVLRINCAHEGEAEWASIVQALREAEKETGKPCRLLMDLGGPKIRTGPVALGRRIATWKPVKDELGRVTAPARVVIQRGPAPAAVASGAHLWADDDCFREVMEGDELRFRDAADKDRRLRVVELGPDRMVAETVKRASVLGRARFRLVRAGAVAGKLTLEVADATAAAIDVRPGDALVLTTREVEGTPPVRDASGATKVPGKIGCTLPEALAHLGVGHRVLFDDGRILAVVERVGRARGEYLLRVRRTDRPRAWLRAEKGINLPDTLTTIPSLTAEDRRALGFVVAHADAVGLSFVRRPADVHGLHQELDRLGRPGLGVVLKIETRAGFENLPSLLLEGLHRPPLAVMIARGDLAVEVGFERLAELQEEILWLCEACHVPAIWATQVLDTLARTGVPSRAEVTDAAVGVAAECVMLNKGPFVDEAVRVLADILCRMERHFYKKRNLFGRLQVSSFAER